jgi:hypothetical protein
MSMCGYCTEQAVIGGLLGVIKGDPAETHEPLLRPILLQEAADWREELSSWEDHDHASGALVALCRHWSERISGKNPAPLSDALATDALANLQRWLSTLSYPPDWQWALCVEGLLAEPLPFELARTRLDSYINAWLEPFQSNVIEWDHGTLYECFPSLSISLDVLAQCAAHDPRLWKLATLSPVKAPFFNGLDLWLQRRALHVCVANSGVQFIEENLDSLRDTAIVAVIMSDLLKDGDLSELEAALRSRRRQPPNSGFDDLFETTRLMIHRRFPESGKTI